MRKRAQEATRCEKSIQQQKKNRTVWMYDFDLWLLLSVSARKQSLAIECNKKNIQFFCWSKNKKYREKDCLVRDASECVAFVCTYRERVNQECVICDWNLCIDTTTMRNKTRNPAHQCVFLALYLWLLFSVGLRLSFCLNSRKKWKLFWKKFVHQSPRISSIYLDTIRVLFVFVCICIVYLYVCVSVLFGVPIAAVCCCRCT